jgi:hypothetical protein
MVVRSLLVPSEKPFAVAKVLKVKKDLCRRLEANSLLVSPPRGLAWHHLNWHTLTWSTTLVNVEQSEGYK